MFAMTARLAFSTDLYISDLYSLGICLCFTILSWFQFFRYQRGTTSSNKVIFFLPAFGPKYVPASEWWLLQSLKVRSGIYSWSWLKSMYTQIKVLQHFRSLKFEHPDMCVRPCPLRARIRSPAGPRKLWLTVGWQIRKTSMVALEFGHYGWWLWVMRL